MKKEILMQKTVTLDCRVIQYQVTYEVVAEYDEKGLSVQLQAYMCHLQYKDTTAITKYKLPSGYSLFHLHPLKPCKSVIDYKASLPHVRRDDVSDNSCGPVGDGRDGRFTGGHFQYRVTRWPSLEFIGTVSGSVYPGYGEGGQRTSTAPEALPGDVAWLLDYMEQSIAYAQEVADELRDMYGKVINDGAASVEASKAAVDGVRSIIEALRHG